MEMFNNDPVFSSNMLSKRAKKTFTHSGLIAIASPSGGLLYLPFEITEDAMKAFGQDRAELMEHMIESVKVKFLAAMMGDKYK